MTDRPIIFSAQMVRALLSGWKSQTRRRIDKPKRLRGLNIFDGSWSDGYVLDPDNASWREKCTPYAPGDRLWVREAWNVFSFSEDGEEAWPCAKIPTADEYREVIEAAYRFDMQPIYRESDRARRWFSDQPWRPSIHMPRWASRLTLTVTDVRAQRLQEISAEDATAEGIPFEADALAPYEWSVSRFADLWNSIHGPEAWNANPWVCAIRFTVHRGNIDAMTPPQAGTDSQEGE